ncbi:MAG: hypothetical protein QXP42_05105 [Candidatus Micrarchaeia archaeon]
MIRVNGREVKTNFRSGSVMELLKELEICSQTVVVFRKGRLIPETEMISAEEEIDVQQVVYGG